VEIFIDNFLVFRLSFDNCLSNLRKVSKRCREKNLILNWEKCHFIVKKEIILGYIISRDGIEVDKAMTDLIVNLSFPTLSHLCERGEAFSWTCWLLSSLH